MKFSKDFIFGVATSSYQIEGAYNEGGRTDSIWDLFSKKENTIIDHSTGDIACDHYHLYKDDVQLMKTLGIDAYRFSISWSRIIPEKGKVNQEGIDFYRNLMLELKKVGIKVSITIYHWDLPLWIYDENSGWPHRDTVSYFVEYCSVLFEEFDDLADMWITLNEPWCSANLGYLTGYHAPGHKDYTEFIKAHHHLLLAHGQAVELYRQKKYKKPIGITLNTSQVYAPTDSYLNQLAVNNEDGMRNRLFYDPIFKSTYPFDILNLLSKYINDFSFIKEGDLKSISTPNDFLGINYYTRNNVEYDAAKPELYSFTDGHYDKTEMGWEVTPWTLKDLLIRLRDNYTDIPVYITENGSAYHDILEDGKVHDDMRVEYLESHLKAISELNEMNMNVKGYFAWSLMDNFEWALGYNKRFGIVYVDYKERIPKDSYYRYQEIIKENKE